MSDQAWPDASADISSWSGEGVAHVFHFYTKRMLKNHSKPQNLPHPVTPPRHTYTPKKAGGGFTGSICGTRTTTIELSVPSASGKWNRPPKVIS